MKFKLKFISGLIHGFTRENKLAEIAVFGI